jgi:hypothetical protein
MAEQALRHIDTASKTENRVAFPRFIALIVQLFD